jgi:hypothetical protein
LSILKNGSIGLVDETVLRQFLSTNRPLHVPLKELYHKHGQHHCFFDEEASLYTVVEMIESVVFVQWTWKGTNYSHQRYARDEGLTSPEVYVAGHKHGQQQEEERKKKDENVPTAKLTVVGAWRGWQN